MSENKSANTSGEEHSPELVAAVDARVKAAVAVAEEVIGEEQLRAQILKKPERRPVCYDGFVSGGGRG